MNHRIVLGNMFTWRLLTAAPRSLVILYSLRVIINEQAGPPILARSCICDAINELFSLVMQRQQIVNLQMSHHTGALSSTSLDQIILLTTKEKLERNNHRTNA